MHKTSVYLFRQDLRLEDNLAFSKACSESQFLIPIYCKSPENQKITKWGFPREGAHRSHFLNDSLNDLNQQLKAKGSELCLFEGESIHVLQDLIKQLKIDAIYCEEIAAPEEQNELGSIKNLAKDLGRF